MANVMAGDILRNASVNGAATIDKRKPLAPQIGWSSVASLFAPIMAAYAPRFTPFMAACPSLVAPLHANSLGLGLGYRQCRGDCCNAESGAFSEKRKRL